MTHRRVLMWGTALLCVSWFLHGWQVATPGLYTRSGQIKGPDFVQFYVMGSLARAGRFEVLYDPIAHAGEAQRRIAPEVSAHAPHPNYPPQVALAFAPLARLPYGSALGLFTAVSIITYAVVIWSLWSLAPNLRRHLLPVIVVAAASPALFFTLRFGQLSTLSLLAFAVSGTALERGRRLLAGVALGFISFKPQLLVVAVPALLVARDWRVLAGVGVSIAAQLGFGWLMAGSGPTTEYGRTLFRLAVHPDLVMLYPEVSHSVRGQLRLLGAGPMLASAASLMLLLVGVPAVATVWRSTAPPLVRLGLLLLATLLVTPHLITYDLLLLTVPAFALADWAVANPEDPRAPAAVVLLTGAYFAPFSPIVASLTGIQVSTLFIAMLTLLVWKIAHTTELPAGLAPNAIGPRHG